MQTPSSSALGGHLTLKNDTKNSPSTSVTNVTPEMEKAQPHTANIIAW